MLLLPNCKYLTVWGLLPNCTILPKIKDSPFLLNDLYLLFKTGLAGLRTKNFSKNQARNTCYSGSVLFFYLTRGHQAASLLMQSHSDLFFHQLPDFQIISYLLLISKLINSFRCQMVYFDIFIISDMSEWSYSENSLRSWTLV